MDVGDWELVRRLEARDGPLPERTRSHWAGGACRYEELIGDRPCPWCEAERRRRATEGTPA